MGKPGEGTQTQTDGVAVWMVWMGGSVRDATICCGTVPAVGARVWKKGVGGRVGWPIMGFRGRGYEVDCGWEDRNGVGEEYCCACEKKGDRGSFA